MISCNGDISYILNFVDSQGEIIDYIFFDSSTYISQNIVKI